MSATATELAVRGLKGSSLLGFLAALGASRTVATFPEMTAVRIRWTSGGGSFSPVLRLPSPVDVEAIVEKIHAALRGLAGHHVITADKDLKIPQIVFRKLAAKAAHDFLTHSGNHESSRAV